MKKVGLWPIHVFCNILDRIFNFVHVNEKFYNKNFFLDWFSVLLIVSRILYCLCNLYRGSSIGGNTLYESWKCRTGKRVGYYPIPGLGRNREFSVATGFF